MKKFLFLALCTLAGCSSVINSGDMAFEKTDFHKVQIAEKDYFFEYPSLAQVMENDKERYLNIAYLPGCSRLHFGEFKSNADFNQSFELAQKEIDGKQFEVWYENEKPVFSKVTLKDRGFSFWLFDEYKDVSPCMDFLNMVVGSLTDEPRYKNDKFAFSVKLPEGYQLSELPSGEGVVMKKRVTTQDEKLPLYDVEITFKGMENVDQIEDVPTFVGKKYAGYTAEFADYGEFSGFYVDESDNGSGMAMRHFFVLSQDKEILYEATLKLLSKYFPNHKPGFDGLVSSMKIY